MKHPQWTNLKIFPELAELERDISLLNEIGLLFPGSYVETTNDFVKEHLNTLKSTKNIKIVYCDNYTESFDILLGHQSSLDCRKLKYHNKFLYLTNKCYNIFIKHFKVVNGEILFDNLVCLAMIVKDAGPNFENILTQNLDHFDEWCILDTGSTDGTQELINRVLKDKKGKLYTQPFTNFRDSRNHCLDLAGTRCKFVIMLDDTYILKGNLRKFLNEVRGDTFADSFSLMIQSEDNEYYSNRIIKSKTKLRYIHTIHEVITNENNINVTIPSNQAWIFDHRSDYMEKRTMNRKQLDLELLFKELESSPDDPRTLYYIAQTYGCIGDEVAKAVYFEKRIVLEGYIQERIDALFELARTYNFKVNSETMKLMEPGTKLSKKQWERCKELYIKAYSLDITRPDSLYFLGIHHYLEKEFFEAYNYFKKAFRLGYPINSQYSLKPTLSFHFLPKFLTEVCYYQEDNQLGLESAQLYLRNNPPSNLITNWYNIHKQMVNMPDLSDNPKGTNIFCLVTDGGWEPWTGKDIETKGLGGSETWIIETARYLGEYFNVVVFCNCEKPEFYNNVGYNPISLFHEFIATTVVEYCIISRFTEYLPVALKGHAKNVGVIFHDILQSETVLPINPKLKWVFGLTQWHADQIKQLFPQFDVIYQGYGINETPFEIKKPHNFIYSSFPNRGLLVLLRMWSRIKEVLPDATLNVYCNLDHEWSNQVAPDQLQEIKETIHQIDVTNFGWVPKPVLMKAWARADYWLYPCIFEETFCLTALEAAISKTKVITNGLAGLQFTAKYGKIIPGNPLTTEWQASCLEYLSNPVDTTEINYQFAKEFTWKNQTRQFLELIQ